MSQESESVNLSDGATKYAMAHVQVNHCEDIEELCSMVLQISLVCHDGEVIEGGSKEWPVVKMIANIKAYYDDETGSVSPNVVTRSYGLRQQVMYLKYYKNGKL